MFSIKPAAPDNAFTTNGPKSADKTVFTVHASLFTFLQIQSECSRAQRRMAEVQKTKGKVNKG